MSSGRFGDDVALMGPIMAIGYVGCDFFTTCSIGLDTRTPAGARVLIYQRDQGGVNNWGQTQVLMSPFAGETTVRFGMSLSMWGGYLVVGAPGEANAAVHVGSVHIYQLVGTQFTLIQNITDNTMKSYFGYSVSLRNGILAVGAYGPVPSSTDPGKVYMYELQSGQFVLQSALDTAAVANDFFGTHVPLGFGFAVAVDNNTTRKCVAVGAPNTDYDDTTNNQGVAAVFCKNTGWNDATVTTFVHPSGVCTDWISGDIVPAKSMQFGGSVGLDGDTLMIGAPACNMQPYYGAPAGSVSVFTLSSSGTWSYTKQLNGANLDYGSSAKKFGWKIAMQDKYTVIGTELVNTRGLVEIFYKDLNDQVDTGIWGRAGIVFPPNLNDTASNVGTQTHFGYGVAIDGIIVAASANEKTTTQTLGGQAYVFQRFQCPPMQSYVSTLTNSTSVGCQKCVTGTTTYFNKNTTCDPCGAGYANVSISGVYQCQACQPGTVQPIAGQTSCNNCTMGTYMAGYGQTACVKCPARTYANVTGATACASCSPGTFSNTTGLANCYPCAAGTRTRYSGQIACSGCSPGTYTNYTGMTTCLFCPAGKIAPNSSSAFCSDCTIGYTSLGGAPGQTVCEVCQRGEYNNKTGEDCKYCPMGYYQNKTGQTTCDPCPAGYSTNIEGETSCVQCGQGSYGNMTGQSGCTPCPVGKISVLPAQTNDSACFWCQPGQYSGLLRSSTCTDCPAKLYAPTPLQWCLGCPLGSMNAVNGSVDCLCNDGYMMPFNVSGTANTTGHPELCVVCPDEYNCATNSFNGLIQQSKCKYGFMANNQSLCTPCPGFASCATCTYSGCTCNEGYHVDPDEGVACTACPASATCLGGTSTPQVANGYWGDSSNYALWSKCKPAARCPGGGLNVCAANMQGAMCAQCVAGTYMQRHSGLCQPCPATGGIAILAIVFIAGIEALMLYVIRASYLNISSFGSFIVAFNWCQLFGLMYVYPLNWGQTEDYVIRLTGLADFNIDFFFPECISYMGYSATTYEKVWYYKMLMPVPVFGAMAVNCVVVGLIFMMFKRDRFVKMLRALIQSVVVLAQMFFIPYMVTVVDPWRCSIDPDGGPNRWLYNYDYLCGVGAAWQESMKQNASSAGVLYGVCVLVGSVLYLLWSMRGAMPKPPPPKMPPMMLGQPMQAQGPAAFMVNGETGDPNNAGRPTPAFDPNNPNFSPIMMEEGSKNGLDANGLPTEHTPLSTPGLGEMGADEKTLSGAAAAQDAAMTAANQIPQMPAGPPNQKEIERASQYAGILVRRFNTRRYLWSVVTMLRHTLAYLGPFIVFIISTSISDYIRLVVHLLGHVLSLNFMCLIGVYKIGGIRKLEFVTQLSIIAPTVIAILVAQGTLKTPAVMSSVLCICCSAALAYSIYFVIKHAVLVNKAAKAKEERRKEWEAMMASQQKEAEIQMPESPAPPGMEMMPLTQMEEYAEVPSFGPPPPGPGNDMAMTPLAGGDQQFM